LFKFNIREKEMWLANLEEKEKRAEKKGYEKPGTRDASNSERKKRKPR